MKQFLEGFQLLNREDLLVVNGGYSRSGYGSSGSSPTRYSVPTSTGPSSRPPYSVPVSGTSGNPRTYGVPGSSVFSDDYNPWEDYMVPVGGPFDDMNFYNWEATQPGHLFIQSLLAGAFNYNRDDIDFSNPEEGRNRTASLYFDLGLSGLTTNSLKQGLAEGGSRAIQRDGRTFRVVRSSNSYMYEIIRGNGARTTYFDFDGDGSVDGVLR